MVWVSEYIVIFGFVCVCVCASRVSVRLCMVGPVRHEARVDLMIDTDTDTRTYLYICTSKYIHPKNAPGAVYSFPKEPRTSRPSFTVAHSSFMPLSVLSFDLWLCDWWGGRLVS